MKYLVDTDWVIDHFRNTGIVTRKLEELAVEGVAISLVSLAELFEGVHLSKTPKKSRALLEEFLAPDLRVLGIDENTCEIFGEQRARLRKKGQLISDFDLLIGSIALRHNLTLLTNNRKHFERVEGLKIISAG